MVRPFVGIHYDNEGTSGRDKGKIGVRHLITLTAGHSI